jgi:4-amino-4-deoxy-L-arabinose transferase-like glycosyltransferase
MTYEIQPTNDRQRTTNRQWIILLLILLLAAFLRLFKLGQSPPGLYQDEAAGAWNAYCLLKTGKDQVGASWPIYYMHGLGGKPTTLHVYALLPFQLIGGLNIFTTRLPAAVGGIFTVLLIYFVGKRLFDTPVALAAAALLAIDPWQIQQSRWGHDAALCALLGIAPLAALLWADMPVSDIKAAVPRPAIAAFAGTVTGIVCYGYHAMRLFIPALLLMVGIVTLPGWRRILKTRKGILAVAAFGIAFAATFGPLAWQHIFHPEIMARPDQYQRMVFAMPLPLALREIAFHYIQHFGPDFLFIHGDPAPIKSPPGIGQFQWYMLPLMLSGLIFLICRFRHSCAARIILVYVLVYPVGDCFNQGASPHALRSLPALCGLILLAAVGADGAVRWLWKRNRNLATTITVMFILLAVVMNIRYFHRFYGEYNRQPEIYHLYHTDLVEACEWLKPRFDEFDAVFCTTKGMNMPYIITLVVLGYEPNRWFNEKCERFIIEGQDDLYTRYGKMYFMYDELFKPPEEKYLAGRVLLIIRPGEVELPDPNKQIIHKIRRPDGQEALWLCRL